MIASLPSAPSGAPFQGTVSADATRQNGDYMNCLCNLFDDCSIWVIIIALIILLSGNEQASDMVLCLTLLLFCG